MIYYFLLQDGSHKILDECSLPLTGKNCVDCIITEMVCVPMYKQTCDYVCTCCVQDKEKGLILVEISERVTINDIKQATGCSFEVSYYKHLQFI